MLPHKAPNQNKHWLDSMKRIVNNGFELNTQDKNNWKKQLTYVNTCTNLGRYYEWAYDKRYVKNMQPALKYYNKVIELDRFPDKPIYFKALAIRTNIYRKLDDIYYKGKGVRKNKKLSLELALDGIGDNNNLVEFYSKRYFGFSNRFFCKEKNINDTIGAYFRFEITPFAEAAGFTLDKQIDKEIKILNEVFKKLSKLDSSEIIIKYNGFIGIKSRVYGYGVLRDLKNIFKKKYSINPNLITEEYDIVNLEKTEFYIEVKKKKPNINSSL